MTAGSPRMKRRRIASSMRRTNQKAPESYAAVEKQGCLRRFAYGLRNHPIVVIIETLGLLGLIVAVIVFFFELRERQEERTSRSWQLLTTIASGNSGKREALEYLNSESGCQLRYAGIDWCWKSKTPLTGIDLSKQTHGGKVFLSEVNLQGADLTGANLEYAILENANLTRAILVESKLSRANFRGAKIEYAVFREADLSHTELFFAPFTSASFIDANISGGRLGEGQTCSDQYKEGWAWADQLPREFDGCQPLPINTFDPGVGGQNRQIAEKNNFTVFQTGAKQLNFSE